MDENVKIEGNIDFEKALKEFESKSAQETPKTIQDVKKSTAPESPKMVRLVIKYSGGIIKEQQHAEYFLLGLVAIMIGISIFLYSA